MKPLPVFKRRAATIAAPEEIAFSAGWISADELRRHIERRSPTQYTKLLAVLLAGEG